MRILIVDDNDINRKLLRITLATEGHEAVEAADGVKAFEKLHSGKFDAVMTDILVPKIDGYQICYRIRRTEALRDLPIIIYSSTYTSAADEQIALKVGADRFLRKPAASEILQALDEAVRAPGPRGEAVAPGPELQALEEYSEALVRRLEGANADLEASQRRLVAACDSLRESERVYRELVDLAPTGIVRTTPAGKVLAANAAFAEMLGYGSAEELLGLDVGRDLYFDPEERAAVIEHWARPELAAAIEFRLKRRDGTPIWAQGDGRAVLESSGNILRYEVFVQDIDQRKKGEESLQKLQRAVEQAENVVFMTDPDGAITYANPAFERVYGYTREDALGKNPRILKGGGHDRAYYERFWGRLLAGESVREEFVNRRRNGELVTVEASVSPVLDARRKLIGFIAVQHDVTERKRANEALWQAEERYRSLIESSRDLITIIDPGGTIRFASPSIERIGGYRADELVGQNAFSYVHPEDAARLRARLAEILTSETPTVPISFRFRHRDGTWRVFESVGNNRVADPQVGGVVLNSRDITEMKRAEKEMRKSEERFRKLFDSNTIGIVIADLSGNTLEANDAYLNMLGYTSEELLAGRIRWNELTPAEYLPRDQAAIEELRRTGIASSWEKELIRKDGSRVPILIGVAMLRASEGSCIAYIVDLSERRKLEEQFRQAQKMEAVGQLAGGVAHDFNNMLTAILGYAELLAEKLKGRPREAEDLDEIRKAGERAASLTRQLLAFSRRQVFERKVLDLNRLIAEIERMLRRLIGEDVDLVTALDPALAYVWADAGQLEQVVMNLAVNARDAMPRGGELTIETANVELDEAYARLHIPLHPGRYVMIAVSDTGVGMDAATRSRIFEPFFTTKELGKGTGLGLATVYGIVKQSGGYIWAYSEPGKGTTFKIYLPPAVQSLLPEEDRVGETLSVRGTETVLLVEDEESVRTLARAILETYGYRVLEAAGAEEAIETARGCQQPIHLLFTDVVMPSMGGPDLAARIQTLRPGIKVLYMSGYTGETVFRHGHLEQGRLFLQKPFTPEALARKLREALRT